MNALLITTIEEAYNVPVTFEPRSFAEAPEEDRSSTDPDILAQPTTQLESATQVKAPFHNEGIHRWFREWGLNE